MSLSPIESSAALKRKIKLEFRNFKKIKKQITGFECFFRFLSDCVFLCLEQAPACFNARGWILTTDFTAPSRTLHPKVLNELHSQNRRRLYYRRPPRCKDMIRDVEDNGQESFVAMLQTLISLINDILGKQRVRQADKLLVIKDRDLAWSPHPIPKEPEQLSGQKPASCKDGPFGTGKKGVR